MDLRRLARANFLKKKLLKSKNYKDLFKFIFGFFLEPMIYLFVFIFDF